MSSANLSIDSIIQLVSLGLRLSSALVERHAGKSLSAMSDSDVHAALAHIRATAAPEDELIAEGQHRGQEASKGKTPAMESPAAIMPSSSPSPDLDADLDAPQTGFDTGQDFGDESDFEDEVTLKDEGDDQGTPV